MFIVKSKGKTQKSNVKSENGGISSKSNQEVKDKSAEQSSLILTFDSRFAHF
jgi:hypothetical protein